jgi:uncharacterized protein
MTSTMTGTMTGRHIFHLSIPVADLASAKKFYIDVLEAKAGREHEDWLDILLWGHQITLQKRPTEVLPLSRQGKRHFGVTLPWPEWERNVQRLRSLGVEFLSPPLVLLKDSPEEQAKFYLADPSNNVIEVKSYRDIVGTLGIEL